MKKTSISIDNKIFFTKHDGILDITLFIGNLYQRASINIETVKLDIWIAWRDALRSGKFKKCKNMLYDSVANSFCSLGVLQNILGTYWVGQSRLALTDREMSLFAEPNINLQLFFSTLNDTPKVETSFNLISDIIQIIIEMIQDDQSNSIKEIKFTANGFV